MATTTGPSLEAGRRAVERLMDDTVTIMPTVEPKGWLLDPVTLRLVPPPGAEALYSGRCKFKPAGTQPSSSAVGGVISDYSAYELDLPIASDFIPEGAEAVITSSRRFPNAVGLVLVVGAPILKTLAIQAKYVAERIKRVEQ